MTTFNAIPLWWDKEFDSHGNLIRADVRRAACEVWRLAYRRSRSILNDVGMAAEIFERSVSEISRYVDHSPARDQNSNISGLILVAFTRGVRRRAIKLARTQSVDCIGDFADQQPTRLWNRQVESRIELEEIVKQLSERNGKVLALRYAGYEWKEIGSLLGCSVSLVRTRFWREINALRKHLQSNHSTSRLRTVWTTKADRHK